MGLEIPTPAPKSGETERAPSMGERLAHDYLIRYKIKDPDTRQALDRMVLRARNEYVAHAREVKDVPEAANLADYINGQMPQILKEVGHQPAELYAEVMEVMTDYIKRQSKIRAVRKAA